MFVSIYITSIKDVVNPCFEKFYGNAISSVLDNDMIVFTETNKKLTFVTVFLKRQRIKSSIFSHNHSSYKQLHLLLL